MAERIIFHLDLDAFFASCEEMRRPELKGKPLVVGSDPRGGKGRGIVTTANYEARKFGIKSAMPISMAWRACPDANFVPTDHTFYSSVARRIFDALKERHPVFERTSIDEAYLDVTSECTWDTAEALARDVQLFIAKVSGGLGISIGIAPNKLVAKIASDFRKPRGVTLVRSDLVQSFLDPLGVRKIPGIGPKTEPELHALGIHTIRELRNADAEMLRSRFGSHGDWMLQAAQGRHGSTVNTLWEPNKSISSEHTYFEDTRNPFEIRSTLRRIMSDLEHELSDGYWWKTVALKIRYQDFETVTRQASIPHPAKDTTWARRAVLRLLEGALSDPRHVRLVGLRLGDLVYAPGQPDLRKFEQAITA